MTNISEQLKNRPKQLRATNSRACSLRFQLDEEGNDDGEMGDAPAPHVCDPLNRKAEASKQDIECFSSNSSIYHLPILALSYISLLFVRLFRRYI